MQFPDQGSYLKFTVQVSFRYSIRDRFYSSRGVDTLRQDRCVFLAAEIVELRLDGLIGYETHKEQAKYWKAHP